MADSRGADHNRSACRRPNGLRPAFTIPRDRTRADPSALPSRGRTERGTRRPTVETSGKAPTSVTDVDGERPGGAHSVTSPSADEVEKAAAAATAAEAARVQAESEAAAAAAEAARVQAEADADAAAVAAEVAQAQSDTTAGRPAASGQQQAPAAAPPVQQEGGGAVVRVDGPGPVYTDVTQEEVDRLLTEHQNQTDRPGCQPGMLGC